MQQHPGAKLLAGGHSLIPLLKLRLTAPTALIDIGRIAELKGIASSGGTIRIGALTTHAELASSPVLKSECPMLCEAAGNIGDPQVRNCGTIGGNVAHADPASDLPTVLLALDARFAVTGSKGERTIAAGDFFQGMMTTALDARRDSDRHRSTIQKGGAGDGVRQILRIRRRGTRCSERLPWSRSKGGSCGGAQVAIGGLRAGARPTAAMSKAP